jgi:hypothetical protein
MHLRTWRGRVANDQVVGLAQGGIGGCRNASHASLLFLGRDRLLVRIRCENALLLYSDTICSHITLLCLPFYILHGIVPLASVVPEFMTLAWPEPLRLG